MAFLKMDQGPAPGSLHALKRDQTNLGRSPENEIVLDDGSVSRNHARISRHEDRFAIEDMQSRNGTYVNGDLVKSRTELHEGDIIAICDILLRFFVNKPSDEGSSISSDKLSGLPELTDSSSGSYRRGDGSESEGSSTSVQPGTVLTVEDEEEDDTEETPASSVITTLKADGSDSSWRLASQPAAKLRAIIKITRALRHVLSAAEVLSTILHRLFEIFPQAQEGFVLLRDPVTNEMVVRATHVRSGGTGEDSNRVQVSRTVVRQALKSSEGILSADALQDKRFALAASVNQLQIRSLMCVPLLAANGEPMGVLHLDTRDVRKQFKQDDLDVLVSVAWQSSLAIENAEMHEAVVRQKELEREISAATEIQQSLLPKVRPEVSGYEIADYYKPARNIGGDMFDYVPLPGDRLGVMIGDVSGKGVPAALLMARLHVETRYHLRSSSNAADAMTNLNREIVAEDLGHHFITFIIAIIDLKKGEVEVANAGHPPILLRHPNGEIQLVGKSESGLPLGLNGDWEYGMARDPIPVGSTFVMYTDGVSETRNQRNELFGWQRVSRKLQEHEGTPTEFVDEVVDDIEAFGGEFTDRDDTCLVCIRRNS